MASRSKKPQTLNRFRQAAQAIKAMPRAERLQILVKTGQITQEQADAAIKRLSETSGKR